MKAPIYRFIDYLYSQVGYTEGANNNNKYGAQYGLNNCPYCVIFVWCAFQNSKNKKRCFNKTAVCSGIETFARARSKWVTKDYQAGDVVIFDFNKDGVNDHTGVIVDVLGNGYYSTIEGNTSPSAGGSQSNGDGVYIKERHISQIKGAYRSFKNKRKYKQKGFYKP